MLAKYVPRDIKYIFTNFYRHISTNNEANRKFVILISNFFMSCQAYGCLTRQGYGKSLFCFPDPVKKKELYLTWLTNLSIEESFTSDKHKLVCEDHFKTSCFEGNLMVILFIFLIILNI